LNQLIMGRFLVHERIGTGGMGTVYRAEQKGLDRAVALKVLKKELISDRETVVRFHREAKAMSMLMHPNTVRVFDFGEDDQGHLFLAMELLEGELLTSWAEREITPPIREVIGSVREILRSLNEAHSKGLIHRDLKPDNIYLARVEGSPRPTVKVLDFGIAKVFRGDKKIDELETQAGTVFGTPRYMSPEQAQGKTLDHRSDLYSVGVLLYQLLTGQPPFLDDDAVVVMAKHIREVPPTVRELAPDRPIPKSLDAVVTRALAKHPEDRYENADAFESALDACLPDVDLEAERWASGRPSGMMEAVSELPRVPLAIGGSLVVAALVIAGIVVASAGPDEVAARPPSVSITAGNPPTETAVQPAPEPAATDVQLTSLPSGAAIFEGETRVGETPHTFSLGADQSRMLTLRLEGHLPTDVELRADAAPGEQVLLSEIDEPEAAPPENNGRSRSRRRREPRPAEAAPVVEGPSTSPYSRFD